MKHRIFVFLLAAVICFQTVVEVRAVSVRPDDAATKENVLEVLRQYDAGAYHIMSAQADRGSGFLSWFSGKSLIAGMDTAVHETYHGYTHSQGNGVYGIYGERLYLGDGKDYEVDCSLVYRSGNFTKTEEMSKQIPSQLRTVRYNSYVAPGLPLDANTKSVFGLLNEFTAYYWGLETMNSLVRFLMDTDAGADAWKEYVVSIGNDMTAYAEFKYWTLRYMLYIRSANPSLYQAILSNESYCAAYRDADVKFAAEIERSREMVNNSAEYLREKGYSVEWSDSRIFLRSGNAGKGVLLTDYTALMAELETAEYLEMDSVLKGVPAPAFRAVLSPQKLTVNGVEVDCEKYNIDGSNYFKLRDIAWLLRDSAARFSVVWDAASGTVSITSGRTYTPDGSEMAADGADKSGSAVESSQTILVNGRTVSNLSVYNIGGNNFFKLRDLAGLLGFGVNYIAETDTAAILY